MKKKVFYGIAILIIVGIVAFNVNINAACDHISLLSLANIEALANEGENNSEINKVEEKQEITTSYGPYWTDYKGEYCECYEMYKIVNCLGTGNVACIPSSTNWLEKK